MTPTEARQLIEKAKTFQKAMESIDPKPVSPDSMIGLWLATATALESFLPTDETETVEYRTANHFALNAADVDKYYDVESRRVGPWRVMSESLRPVTREAQEPKL